MKVKKENLTDILTEYTDPEILQRLPEWFRVLRDVYQKKIAKTKSGDQSNQTKAEIGEDEFVRRR